MTTNNMFEPGSTMMCNIRLLVETSSINADNFPSTMMCNIRLLVETSSINADNFPLYSTKTS